MLFLFRYFLLLSRVVFVVFFFPFFPAKETKTPPPRQVLSLAFQPLKSAPGNTPNKVTREKTPQMPTCSSTTSQPVSVETFSGLRLRSAAQQYPCLFLGISPSSDGRENAISPISRDANHKGGERRTGFLICCLYIALPWQISQSSAHAVTQSHAIVWLLKFTLPFYMAYYHVPIFIFTSF